MQYTVVPALRMVVFLATSGGALAVTLFLIIVEGVGELAASQLFAFVGKPIARRGAGDRFQTAIGLQLLEGEIDGLGITIQKRFQSGSIVEPLHD